MNGIARLTVGIALLLGAATACGADKAAGPRVVTPAPSSSAPKAAPPPSAPAVLAPTLTELPKLGELDGLRGASAVTNADIAVLAPVLSQHTAPAGAEMAFDGTAGGVSFAIYRVTTPVGTLINATASGSGALWLLAADYGRGYWYPAAKLAGGMAQIDLSTLIDPTSPGDFVYVAVACEPGQNGSLAQLFVSYDAPVQGPTYYVAPTGDDGNDGSQGSPWLTLQYAADTVVAGDTVVVMPGDYTAFMLQKSGAAGQPISFLAQPGANIIDVNPTNHTDGINIENWGDGGPGAIHDVVVDGFTVDGDNCVNRPRTGIRIVGGGGDDFANHITITNNTCLHCGKWGILTGFVSDILIQDNECAYSIEQHGIYHSNSGDRATIRGNLLHDNAGCGQHMNGDASLGGDGILSDCLVENNICYRNGASGGSAINCDGVQDSVISGNLIFENDASGISLYDIDAAEGAKRNLVLCNTIIESSVARWCLNITNGSTDNRLYNNILYNHHSAHGSITIDGASLPGLESDYNAVMDRFSIDDGANLTLAQWQGATGQDAHSFVSSPDVLLVDEPGQDFHLKAGSPAIDAGFDLGADMPALDIDGVTRPNGGTFDLGALEYEP